MKKGQNQLFVIWQNVQENKRAKCKEDYSMTIKTVHVQEVTIPSCSRITKIWLGSDVTET